MSNDDCSGQPASHGPFTIAFFGRRCRLTRIPVEHLASTGASIVAIFVPSSSGFGPALRRISARPSITLGVGRPHPETETLDQVAIRNEIPMYAVARPLAGDLETTLATIAPDLIVVSCFPWRIPWRTRQIAPFGVINLHPSLLPRFRGPDPLFWAFQTGTHDWGVTVHRMTDRLDRGPILAQRSFVIPPRIAGDDLESLAARIGAESLRDAIDRIRDGTVEALPQEEAEATYLPFPSEFDRVIERDWTAPRALNFVAGITSLGYVPLVRTRRGVFEVVSAVESPDPSDEMDEQWRSASVVRLVLDEGSVDFTVRPD